MHDGTACGIHDCAREQSIHHPSYHTSICVKQSVSCLVDALSNWGWGRQIGDEAWIKGVISGEDQVQREDVSLCDLVQQGIQSPAYDVGRQGIGWSLMPLLVLSSGPSIST